jgi:hypothetical protein
MLPTDPLCITSDFLTPGDHINNFDDIISNEENESLVVVICSGRI